MKIDPFGSGTTPPQDGECVGYLLDFSELVADEGDRFALGCHPLEGFDQFVGFLGGEHGGRFIHDQDVGTAVENL